MIALVAVVGGCFLFELFISRPDMVAVARGFVPTTEIVTNPDMLYLALGILGATVMPHNLYLHSSSCRRANLATASRDDARRSGWPASDSTIALSFALLINASILILAAATFNKAGKTDIAELQQAQSFLTALLGSTLAPTLFGIALLCCGLNSTVTATLAGQIVMEGFLNLRIRPWLRRLITRAIAIVPAAFVAVLYGESGTAKLLVFSQVILSLQLSFAVFPLVRFTSDREKMGEFVNSTLLRYAAYLVAFIIASLNFWLLWLTLREWVA